MELKEAIERIPEYRPGEIVKAKIVTISSDGVIVDIGQKTEGLIPNSEFTTRGIPEDFCEGKEIQVVVLGGQILGFQAVSYNQARQRLAWKYIKSCYQNNEPISGKIVKKVKGGFIVDIGVDAFLPMSQSEKSDEKNIKVLITELDEKQKSVVVSQKKYTQLEKERSAEKIFSSLSVGDVVEGEVRSICNFGVFVDIGGVDGLVHISDLSWWRVDKPQDVVKLGDKLKLKVLQIDKENKKISLGLKQLLEHPWEKVGEKYFPGSIVTGKIKSITDFGAFVELEPGVEGLLHVSELSWRDKNVNPREILDVNKEYQLKVIEVNCEAKKIALSLKRLQENPWEKLKIEYPPGTKLKCKVTKLLPFGALVQLPLGLEGLIHINDMSWMKKIKHPKEVVDVDDEIDAVLLEVEPDEEKAIVSIKHLTEDPFEKYSVGKTVQGTVSRIGKFGVFVKLDDESEAFLHKSEFDIERNSKKEFQIGEEIRAKVIRSDGTSRKIEISIKKLKIDEERELIKKYSAVEKPRLGDILEEKEE